MLPNLRNEKRLWKTGHKKITGLDEAGRGPLAGPVVAAAVILNLKGKSKKEKRQLKSKKFNNLTMKQFSNLGIQDSKKLSSVKREELYKTLTKSDLIEWGIGRVSERVIEKINILEATKLAMKKAIRNLEKKYSHGRIRISRGKKPSERFSHADFLILDGNFKINLDVPQKSIVKADEKVFSCASASIIAKVTRDRIMQRYHKKYPRYGFSKHKGYPTKYHLKMLKKYGPCKIHRKSFKPVQKLLNC